ncbi:MAG: hypothetical protein FWD40_10465 [Treponema sp.]|nr:hypothetical protein [Treponema sp.]
MKKSFKLLGFIALAVILAFSMAACGDPPGGGGGGDGPDGPGEPDPVFTISGTFASQNDDASGEARFFASAIEDDPSASTRWGRSARSLTTVELEGLLIDGDITFRLRGNYEPSTGRYVLSAAASFLRYNISGDLAKPNEGKAIVQVRGTGGVWESIEVDVSVESSEEAPDDFDIEEDEEIYDDLDSGIPEDIWGIWWGQDEIRFSEFDVILPGNYYYAIDAFTVVLYINRHDSWSVEGYTCFFEGVEENPDGSVAGRVVFDFTDIAKIDTDKPTWWIDWIDEYARWKDGTKILPQNWGSDNWRALVDRYAAMAQVEETPGKSTGSHWVSLFGDFPYFYQKYRKDAFKLDGNYLLVGRTESSDTPEGADLLTELTWEDNRLTRTQTVPPTPFIEGTLLDEHVFIPSTRGGLVYSSYEDKNNVLRIPSNHDWSYLSYDLSRFEGKEITINLSMDYMVNADSRFVWQITNDGEYPNITGDMSAESNANADWDTKEKFVWHRFESTTNFTVQLKGTGNVLYLSEMQLRLDENGENYNEKKAVDVFIANFSVSIEGEEVEEELVEEYEAFEAFNPRGYFDMTSSKDYEVINVGNRTNVLKVENLNGTSEWAVAMIPLKPAMDLIKGSSKEITVRFGASIKRVGAAGTLSWQINQGEYTPVEVLLDAGANRWHQIQGEWTGTPNSITPFLYLSTWDNNSPDTTYYVDFNWIGVDCTACGNPTYQCDCELPPEPELEAAGWDTAASAFTPEGTVKYSLIANHIFGPLNPEQELIDWIGGPLDKAGNAKFFVRGANGINVRERQQDWANLNILFTGEWNLIEHWGVNLAENNRITIRGNVIGTPPANAKMLLSSQTYEWLDNKDVTGEAGEFELVWDIPKNFDGDLIRITTDAGNLMSFRINLIVVEELTEQGPEPGWDTEAAEFTPTGIVKWSLATHTFGEKNAENQITGYLNGPLTKAGSPKFFDINGGLNITDRTNDYDAVDLQFAGDWNLIANFGVDPAANNYRITVRGNVIGTAAPSAKMELRNASQYNVLTDQTVTGEAGAFELVWDVPYNFQDSVRIQLSDAAASFRINLIVVEDMGERDNGWAFEPAAFTPEGDIVYSLANHYFGPVDAENIFTNYIGGPLAKIGNADFFKIDSGINVTEREQNTAGVDIVFTGEWNLIEEFGVDLAANNYRITVRGNVIGAVPADAKMILIQTESPYTLLDNTDVSGFADTFELVWNVLEDFAGDSIRIETNAGNLMPFRINLIVVEDLGPKPVPDPAGWSTEPAAFTPTGDVVWSLATHQFGPVNAENIFTEYLGGPLETTGDNATFYKIDDGINVTEREENWAGIDIVFTGEWNLIEEFGVDLDANNYRITVRGNAIGTAPADAKMILIQTIEDYDWFADDDVTGEAGTFELVWNVPDDFLTSNTRVRISTNNNLMPFRINMIAVEDMGPKSTGEPEIALLGPKGSLNRLELNVIAGETMASLIGSGYFGAVGTADFVIEDDIVYVHNIANNSSGLRVLPAGFHDIEAGDMLRATGRTTGTIADSRLELAHINAGGGAGLGDEAVTPGSQYSVPATPFTFTHILTAGDIENGLRIAPNGWSMGESTFAERFGDLAFSIDDLVIFRPEPAQGDWTTLFTMEDFIEAENITEGAFTAVGPLSNSGASLDWINYGGGLYLQMTGRTENWHGVDIDIGPTGLELQTGDKVTVTGRVDLGVEGGNGRMELASAQDSYQNEGGIFDFNLEWTYGATPPAEFRVTANAWGDRAVVPAFIIDTIVVEGYR